MMRGLCVGEPTVYDYRIVGYGPYHIGSEQKSGLFSVQNFLGTYNYKQVDFRGFFWIFGT